MDMPHRRGTGSLWPGDVGSVCLRPLGGGLPGGGVPQGSAWFEEPFKVEGAASARSWRRPQASVEKGGWERREEEEGGVKGGPLGPSGPGWAASCCSLVVRPRGTQSQAAEPASLMWALRGQSWSRLGGRG